MLLLPINNISLLNYIKTDGSQTSLLNALNQKLNNKQEKTMSSAQRNEYEGLEQKAGELGQSAQALLKEGEDGLFREAEINGENQKLYIGIKDFFDDYNSTLKTLQSVSGTMNNFYHQSLVEASSKSKESLESLGITFSKDGTAYVDMEKIKVTDMVTLKETLGKESDFIEKVDFLSSRISDYAKANVESVSSTYNSAANLYFAGNGKYNFYS